jgi:hypothetical protein
VKTKHVRDDKLHCVMTCSRCAKLDVLKRRYELITTDSYIHALLEHTLDLEEKLEEQSNGKRYIEFGFSTIFPNR